MAQEEIREVAEYARALHITVIPEIEMPGHSEGGAGNSSRNLPAAASLMSIRTCVLAMKKPFEFLENVLEVIELFPSNISILEVMKRIKRVGRHVRAVGPDEAEGLEDVDGLQSYLVHRIEVFLTARDAVCWAGTRFCKADWLRTLR